MGKGRWRKFKYGVVKVGQIIEIKRDDREKAEVVKFLGEKEFPRYCGHDNYFRVQHEGSREVEDVLMQECPKGNYGYGEFNRCKFRVIK